MGEGERRIRTPQVSALGLLLAILAALPALGPIPAGIPVRNVEVNPASGSLSVRGWDMPAEARPDSAAPLATPPPDGVHFDHVVVIVLENKGICDILTTCGGAAPYLTSLANASGLATHYRDCTFPSLPNYLCLTAASTFGCTTNPFPNSNPCAWAAWNATNLVDRLVAANLTWKAYMDGMPSNCYPANYGTYAVRHNPFVYYGDIATNGTRCARVVPSGTNASALLADLADPGTASNFMWFTPDTCHDMHSCSVASGDAYLENLVPRILNSTVFRARRAALLITFDEDAGGLGAPNMYTVWAGPAAKPAFRSSAQYMHYSALRTIEANWNLTPLNGNDTAAPTMNEFFLSGPVARFDFSPAWPRGNETVAFDASASTDPDPNATLQFRWDWTDDGVWDTPWSTDPRAVHTYDAAGIYPAEVQVQDPGGLLDETVRPVTVDDAPPSTASNLSGLPGRNGWYAGPVTVTLNATDDLSGVSGTTYSLDGGADRPYGGPFAVSADGLHNVSYESVDRASNVEARKAVTFRIDQLAPTTNVTFSGTLEGNRFVTPILVTLVASDPTSGVATTPVSVDGGPWTNYTGPFNVSNVGEHSVHYHSVDVAGNIEAVRAFSAINGTIGDIVLRSEALLNGTAGSAGWYNSPVTVTLRLVNGTSPPDWIEYRLDGGSWIRYSDPFLAGGDGVHVLDFNATDGIGLVEVTNHVTFGIDTVPPSTTAVVGTLGANGWYVSPASVTLTSTDATSGVANLSYRLDGGSWLAYTAPIGLADGSHSLNYKATDVAGLTEPVHTRLVQVDTAPPATVATLSGTLGSEGWYVSNVTVTLSAADATSGVAGISCQIDGGAWTTYSASFVLPEGSHALRFYATDVAGNVEATQAMDVLVDTTPPVTTSETSGTVGENGWFSSNVTVALNATDGASGVAGISYRIDGGPWLAYAGPFVVTEGRHRIEYYATDVAGLSEIAKALDVLVDTTAPSTTASLSGNLGGNGWYVTDVSVRLNASDGTSGVASVVYRVDGGAWTTYTGAFVLHDGIHSVEYYATDLAGLSEDVQALAVAVDTAAPSTIADLSGEAGANGWFIDNVTVSLDAMDGTSGVAGIYYRIDGGPWVPYTGPFVLGEGVHVLEYYATDSAGNKEAVQSRTVSIDPTPPVTTATQSGTPGSAGWYTSTVSMDLNATDPLSGVAGIRYRVDGGPWTLYSGPILLMEGIHTVDFAATSGAGLDEPIQSLIVRIDTTPPASSESESGDRGDNGWYRSNVTVTLTGTDAGSGIAGITYRLDGGPWLAYSDPFVVSDGEHVLEFFSTDIAGLAGASQSTWIRVNTVAPLTTASIAGTPGNEGWYVSEVSVTLTATARDGGLDRIDYRLDGGPWTVYSGPIALVDGRHTIDYYAVDRSGHAEPSHSMTLSIDTIAPATNERADRTLGNEGWYVSNVSVTLASSDGGSGVAAIRYRLDGGDWIRYTGSVPVTGGGIHILEFAATDVAGNLELVRSLQIAIDLSGPQLVFLSPSGNLTESPAHLAWEGTDDESGIARYELSIDGGPFESLGLVHEAWLNLSEGAHEIRVRATDHAGLSTVRALSLDIARRSGSVSLLADLLPDAIVVVALVGAGVGIWWIRSRRTAKEPQPKEPESPPASDPPKR